MAKQSVIVFSDQGYWPGEEVVIGWNVSEGQSLLHRSTSTVPSVALRPADEPLRETSGARNGSAAPWTGQAPIEEFHS